MNSKDETPFAIAHPDRHAIHCRRFHSLPAIPTAFITYGRSCDSQLPTSSASSVHNRRFQPLLSSTTILVIHNCRFRPPPPFTTAHSRHFSLFVAEIGGCEGRDGKNRGLCRSQPPVLSAGAFTTANLCHEIRKAARYRGCEWLRGKGRPLRIGQLICYCRPRSQPPVLSAGAFTTANLCHEK